MLHFANTTATGIRLEIARKTLQKATYYHASLARHSDAATHF